MSGSLTLAWNRIYLLDTHYRSPAPALTAPNKKWICRRRPFALLKSMPRWSMNRMNVPIENES